MKRRSVDITVSDQGIVKIPLSGKPGASVTASRKQSPPPDNRPYGVEPPGAENRAMNKKDRLPFESFDPTGSSGKEGANRAARLLLALGPDQAALILKEMNEKEIEPIVKEMVALKKISPEEKAAILMEFEEDVAQDRLPVQGGMDAAREILLRTFGETKTQEYLSRLDRRDMRDDFLFLEQIEPNLLASSLMQEHPQVAAVALSFLRPKVAAEILKIFEEPFRSQVAMRIARTANTHPEAVLRVAKVLRDKFEKRNTEIYSDTGGVETLANILNFMDRRAEEEIMGVIGNQSPDLMENVRERLYTFEELIGLDHREIRLLIARLDDDRIIATALRGAGEEYRRHFFNSMSQNRASDILELMDIQGTLTLREVNEARTYILNVARRLDEEGSIVIKKGKEEFL